MRTWRACVYSPDFDVTEHCPRPSWMRFVWQMSEKQSCLINYDWENWSARFWGLGINVIQNIAQDQVEWDLLFLWKCPKNHRVLYISLERTGVRALGEWELMLRNVGKEQIEQNVSLIYLLYMRSCSVLIYFLRIDCQFQLHKRNNSKILTYLY